MTLFYFVFLGSFDIVHVKDGKGHQFAFCSLGNRSIV
jgi:hypothetical protein